MNAWAIFRGTDEAEQRRREHEASLATPKRTQVLDQQWLKDLCLAAGAADVGFVEVHRPALGAETANAERIFSEVRTLISIVTVTNPEAIRSLSRATANMAWHLNHNELDEAAQQIIHRLNQAGVRAVTTSMGFPMRFEPGQLVWEIAHKPIAVQAGLGHMGIHRNVIHPKFGNFVLLETILIDAEVSGYDQPIDYNPCNGCNLCVAACPVGAVRHDDGFDFFACLQHNYREFLFGFNDWVETISDATDANAYTSKFDGHETRSMWQSLSFGPNYKAAYCMAVCPAGDDVIGRYMADKAAWRNEVMVPLLRKEENVYVTSGTRAEKVALRNASKRVRYVDYKPSVSSPDNFRLGLLHRFDKARAASISTAVTFRFPAAETENGPVVRQYTFVVEQGVATIIEVETEVDGTPTPAAAVVELMGDQYIRLLHPGAAPPTDKPSGSQPSYVLQGDPAAFGAVLASLS
jgi:ferredoxin